jgi:hypothetical protein
MAAAKIFRRRATELAKTGERSASSGKGVDPELQADLQAILLERPRAYGEEPHTPGLYERLCPNTKMHEQALRLKKRIFKS